MNSGLKYAQEYSALINEADIYKILSDIEANKRHFQPAYNYFVKYKAAQDSVSNVELSKRVANLKTNYDLKEQERQNQRLSQEKNIAELKFERSQVRNKLAAVIVILIAILALFIYYFYLRSQKGNKLLIDKNDEIQIAHNLLEEEILGRKQSEKEREKLILELQESLKNVKSLKGLIPICANCKKIRNDEGYYEQLEKYLSEHTDAEFSHGICSDCARELYPELQEMKDNLK